MSLTTDELAAIEESAHAMAAWHDAHRRKDTKSNKANYTTGYNFGGAPEPRANPAQPIFDLCESDGDGWRRLARLSAKAFALSVVLREGS